MLREIIQSQTTLVVAQPELGFPMRPSERNSPIACPVITNPGFFNFVFIYIVHLTYQIRRQCCSRTRSLALCVTFQPIGLLILHSVVTNLMWRTFSPEF